MEIARTTATRRDAEGTQYGADLGPAKQALIHLRNEDRKREGIGRQMVRGGLWANDRLLRAEVRCNRECDRCGAPDAIWKVSLVL